MQRTPISAPRHDASAPHQSRSRNGSMHWPSQAICPVGQLGLHAPATQTVPGPQTSPASAPEQSPVAPQNSRSRNGSTQRLSHSSCPAGQSETQLPATHTSSVPQAVPDVSMLHGSLAPQKRLSTRGSMHSPPQRTRKDPHPEPLSWRTPASVRTAPPTPQLVSQNTDKDTKPRIRMQWTVVRIIRFSRAQQ